MVTTLPSHPGHPGRLGHPGCLGHSRHLVHPDNPRHPCHLITLVTLLTPCRPHHLSHPGHPGNPHHPWLWSLWSSSSLRSHWSVVTLTHYKGSDVPSTAWSSFILIFVPLENLQNGCQWKTEFLPCLSHRVHCDQLQWVRSKSARFANRKVY